MKIVTILGARPNFIKAFLISKELKERGHTEIIVHTGQHYDYLMNQVFFKDLKIPKPTHNLHLTSDKINEMISEIGKLLIKYAPDKLLVYGDTNSTLAGAVAGFMHNIPVAHVEAGERCFDFEMPEERNRVIIDHYSKYLFCPTQNGVELLHKEGRHTGVYFSGNVMYDSIVHFKDALEESTLYKNSNVKSKEYYFMTLHRPQNVDSEEHLTLLLEALSDIKEPIIFSVHPRTKANLKNFGLLDKFMKRFVLIEPLDYLSTLSYVKNARLVLTDSGGLQTDAFCLGTPCITFLNTSAWNQIVESGWNKVVGLDLKKIKKALSYFQKVKLQKANLKIFGNGNAYKKIINILES